MFKKITKKSKNLLDEDLVEEQVEIKPLQTKKKASKWLDIPTKSQHLTPEEISNIINSSDSESSQSEKSQNLKVAEKPRDFNEVFDSLAENIKNRSRLESDGNLSKSSEELEHEEISIDSDAENWKFSARTNSSSKPKLSDLIQYLQEKEQQIEDTKNRFICRLHEINQKKSELNEQIAYLVLENHKSSMS